MSSTQVRKTLLHDIHLQLHAKMGEFAGYDMPLFYPLGVMGEHLHTRSSAGLFDISHMGAVAIKGAEASVFLDKLLPLNASRLPINNSKYSLMLNDSAHIIDDVILSRLGENEYLLVINAGCKEKDFAHLLNIAGNFLVDCHLLGSGMLALQGPKSEAVLNTLGIDCQDLGFMQIKPLGGAFSGATISRSGYTGEDGFEIIANPRQTRLLWSRMMDDKRVAAIGLGARDSLRLEAGLPLYGLDMDEETNPLKTGLMWAIPKELRGFGSYIGADALSKILESPAEERTQAFFVDSKAPVRHGAVIYNKDNQPVGVVTSGGYGPSLDKAIAIGRIKADCDINQLTAELRGKFIPLIPHNKSKFIQTQYKKG